ncbi:MAG TPA: DUF11 domain-containing protein [Actinomycetota bacterium]|nr:DUF11 domain-containing protein [Actinomycetota bacterium]
MIYPDKRSLGRAVFALALLAAVLPNPGRIALATDVQTAPGQPIVRWASHHDTSPPLRDIDPVPLPPGATNVPALELPRRDVEGIEATDPALQTSPLADAAPSPHQTFEGQANHENSTAYVPPDTVGDVGPHHYVQMTNLITSVYDKSGNRLLGPINNNTLWSGFAGAACPIHNLGDPIVLYDQAADRWMLSQFAHFRDDSSGTPIRVGPFYQCIAISQSGNPTGPYHRYEFLIDEILFNDYPKFGVWPDAYYMSVNQFAPVYTGPGAAAFEREQMIQGLPARMVYFDLSATLGPSYGGQLPSDWDGMVPPSAGSPNYFIEADDSEQFPLEFAQDQLSLFEFHVDWASPVNSTFGANAMNDPNAAIRTAPFDSNMCDFARACVPERNVTAADYLDAISDRLMNRLQYRNFGSHETLVANHTVDVGDSSDHAGIRWYEIRDPGGTPTIFQQSTFAPDAEHRWMGSLAMDRQGNLALGYSLSSTNRFPSINYTGRLADDPLGRMRNEALMHAGSGSQVATANRWGDYSSMNVDPVDDCTFWYTQEFYGATAAAVWRTRIGSFRFPGCGDLAVVMSESADPVAARRELTYTARILAGENAMSSVTFTDPLPAGITFIDAATSQGTCIGGSTVTCSLGDLPPGGTATIEILVRTGSAAVVANTASIASTSPDPLPHNNIATVVTNVEEICSTPGMTMLVDRTGDATGANPAHDIERVSVAEPFIADGVEKVFFTLKMASLSELPADTTWLLRLFRSPDVRFVAMKTDSAGQVRFVYGTGTGGTPELGSLDPESNFNADGTITLVASHDKLNRATGQTVTDFGVRIRIEGASVVFPDRVPNDGSITGSYLLYGNSSCKPLDVSASKDGPTSAAPAGRIMTYTINVTNNGPGTATGVLLTDTLPASVTFVSAGPSQGTCTGTATVTCTLGSIDPGSTVTVAIRVTPRQAGTITNTAVVGAHEIDSNTGNNTAVDTTSVCRITSRRSSIPCG